MGDNDIHYSLSLSLCRVYSAGVGRTGTFVTIDTEMQRAQHEGVLNPYSYVRTIRKDRNHMVQTEVRPLPCHTR